MLLSRMLEPHSNKDMMLEDTVKEIMLTCSRASIPKYIDSGLRQLNESADEYIEMINWNKEKWRIRDRQSIIIIMICYNRSIQKKQ